MRKFLAAIALLIPAAAAVASDRPLIGNLTNDWPDIERSKRWKPVLVCEDGRVTVDTAVTRDAPRYCTGPGDEIYYEPFRNCLYEDQLLRNDVQVVIRERAAIPYLDGYIYRNPTAPRFYYEDAWDLQRGHRPVADADQADELVIRGKSRWRISDGASAGDFIVGTAILSWPYAQAEDIIRPTPHGDPTRGKGARVSVLRTGETLRVSLKQTTPLYEVANWVFHGCHAAP